MPSPIFKLTVFGSPSNRMVSVSCYDLSRASLPLVESINIELRALPRESGREELRVAGEQVLRRHGMVGPDAGGWYAGSS